jgi:hypothetical protein
MRRVRVESTSIASVGYEAPILEVRFLNGGLYRYLEVPEEVHAELMQAESKGRFFNRRIRDAYHCERVRPASRLPVADLPR